MDEEPEGEPPFEPPTPETPAPPPKPEIKIREYGARPHACSVCGEAKPPHIEIEVDGVLEYTCRECYEGQVIEVVACRGCGAAMEPADNFCGKCGTPQLAKCPSCGTEVGEEDRFCGKCGAKVT